jgi:hypothetical protein
MKTEIKNRKEMLGRLPGFKAAHPGLVAPETRLADLFAQAESIHEGVTATAAGQEVGTRAYREGATLRQVAAAALREWMSDIACVARSLPVAQYPGLQEKFRMPRSQSYHALRASALAFTIALEPIATLFLERDFAPDFIARGHELIAELDAAGDSKISGLMNQIGQTSGLMRTSSRGLAVVREIDAIFRHKLRNQPALLAEWNSIRRVHRPWKKRRATVKAALPLANPALPPAKPAAAESREWRLGDSNPWPSHCERDALPTELNPQVGQDGH